MYSRTLSQSHRTGVRMKLDLNIQEINAILACLGRAPYEAVFELVEKIRSQAKEQSEAK